MRSLVDLRRRPMMAPKRRAKSYGWYWFEGDRGRPPRLPGIVTQLQVA